MDLESRQPMTQATMFRIASMTKPVIGVAIMMLVEEGRLRLTDPVSRYIPEFHAMKVAPRPGWWAGTGRRASHAVRDITVKDLLTHVSGLGSGPDGRRDIAKVARKEGERLADYIPRLGTTTLEFQPGSRWTYSPGAGFETLGRIVEIASGMPLDQFFRRRIFDPLGMQDIAFWPSAAQWPLVATVYGRSGNGLAKATTPNDTMSRNVYFRGSGGLYSTARGLHPVRHDAGQRRRVERHASAQPQGGGNDDRRTRARHVAGTAGGRRVRAGCPRRHQPCGARHDVVRRHLRLVGRPGHALLRRSQGSSWSA